MKQHCYYCEKKFRKYHDVLICKSCSRLIKNSLSSLMLSDKDRKELHKNSEEYVKEAMTRHTCGLERCVGYTDKFYASDCIGCCPNTKQHYRNAADRIIAWTSNYWKRKIMQEWLIKKKGDTNAPTN